MFIRTALLAQPSFKELVEVVGGIQSEKNNLGVCDKTHGINNWFVMEFLVITKIFVVQ